MTAELSTRIKKPIKVGETLRVEGEILERKSKLLLVKAVVLNDRKEVLASASGKYVPMPQEQISLCSEDFVVSPDAIHPDHLLSK